MHIQEKHTVCTLSRTFFFHTYNYHVGLLGLLLQGRLNSPIPYFRFTWYQRHCATMHFVFDPDIKFEHRSARHFGCITKTRAKPSPGTLHFFLGFDVCIEISKETLFPNSLMTFGQKLFIPTQRKLRESRGGFVMWDNQWVRALVLWAMLWGCGAAECGTFRLLCWPLRELFHIWTHGFLGIYFKNVTLGSVCASVCACMHMFVCLCLYLCV